MIQVEVFTGWTRLNLRQFQYTLGTENSISHEVVQFSPRTGTWQNRTLLAESRTHDVAFSPMRMLEEGYT